MTDNRLKVSGRAGAAPSNLLGRVLETPGRGPVIPRPGTYAHRVEIFGPIGAAGFGLIDLDAALAEIAAPPILLIDSNGGDINSGLAMADRINAASAAVYAHKAQSAAVLLVIAAHHRVIASNGWLAVHPSWTAVAGGAVEFEAAARRCARIDGLLAESIARWSKLNREEAARAIAEGKVWDAPGALAAGLVDAIGPPGESIGNRPDRIDDGPAREAYTLRGTADAARLRAEHERMTRESTSTRDAAPALSRINQENTAAHHMEAFTPPDRLASVFDGAAGHARRAHLAGHAEPWTSRWLCEQCGHLNFHPPAAGFAPTACTHCTTTAPRRTA